MRGDTFVAARERMTTRREMRAGSRAGARFGFGAGPAEVRVEARLDKRKTYTRECSRDGGRRVCGGRMVASRTANDAKNRARGRENNRCAISGQPRRSVGHVEARAAAAAIKTDTRPAEKGRQARRNRLRHSGGLEPELPRTEKEERGRGCACTASAAAAAAPSPPPPLPRRQIAALARRQGS